jgi:hypothetical protein
MKISVKDPVQIRAMVVRPFPVEFGVGELFGGGSIVEGSNGGGFVRKLLTAHVTLASNILPSTGQGFVKMLQRN